MALDQFLVRMDTDIFEALHRIDSNQKGFLIVVNQEEKLQGTLTDGDIRRGLLKFGAGEHLFKGTVKDYFCNACTSISLTEEFQKVINIFKKKAIKFIPIVDEQNKVVNVITKANMHGILLQNIQVDLTYDYISMDENLLEYEINERPWGFYKTTILNSFYQSKVLGVKPMQSLSLQKHEKREEHWIVVNGKGNVQLGESILPVQGGSYLFVPKGCKHRIQNTSADENLILIEVQRGRYFGEDDIIRYDDNYGRI